MNTSPNPADTNRSLSGRLDSKFLAKFTDTESLFARPSVAAPVAKGPSIALERFQQLEQGIRNTPASPEPYVELAQIYIQQNRWNDARRVLDTGYAACNEHEPLLVLREDLILYLANQLVEEARMTMAQEPSDNAKHALEQAEINYANERIRVCRERFARHPDQLDILIHWASGLRQLARLEEAIELLKKAAAQPDLRSRACLQLGLCYQTLQRPLDALASFRRAALFREPEPEPKLKQRALQLALDLAEECSLIDSAIYYAEKLLLDCEPSQRGLLQSRIDKLKSMPV
jgi:tetratricopeptide (TPR) repeat protein